MNNQNPTQNPNRLLVVDQDPESREFVAGAAYELGYCVAQASNDSQFREQFARLKPTVILVDPEGLSCAGIEVFSWPSRAALQGRDCARRHLGSARAVCQAGAGAGLSP